MAFYLQVNNPPNILLLGKLWRENGALKEKNNALQTENAALKEKNAALKEKNSALRSENCNMKLKSDALEVESRTRISNQQVGFCLSLLENIIFSFIFMCLLTCQAS